MGRTQGGRDGKKKAGGEGGKKGDKTWKTR